MLRKVNAVIQTLGWYFIIGLFTLFFMYMYMKKNRENKDGTGYAACAVIFYILLLAMLINIIVYGNKIGIVSSRISIPTGNLDVWVGFFGSLTGAAIGGLITLYVLNMTMKAQEKNTNKMLHEYETQRYLQSAPCISLEVENFNIDQNGVLSSSCGSLREDKIELWDISKDTEFKVNIFLKNIGLGPLLSGFVDWKIPNDDENHNDENDLINQNDDEMDEVFSNEWNSVQFGRLGSSDKKSISIKYGKIKYFDNNNLIFMDVRYKDIFNRDHVEKFEVSIKAFPSNKPNTMVVKIDKYPNIRNIRDISDSSRQ